MQGLFVAVKKSASPRGGPAPHIHPLTAAGSLLRERWPSPEKVPEDAELVAAGC